MAKVLQIVCLGVVAALLCPITAQAQYPSELVGFNGPPINDYTAQEMFRTPQFSGTTSAYILANVSEFDNNAAFRASGLHTEGAAALQVYFNWVDPADPQGWLRLTSYQGEERPNPSLDTRGKVRFKITNRSELIRGEIGVCIGIRETGGVDIPQMGDGGTSGPIEWIGVDTTVNAIMAGDDGLVNTTAIGDDVQEYPVGYDVIANGLPAETAVISPGSNGTIETNPDGDDQDRAGFFLGGAEGDARIPIPAITLPVAPSAYSLEWNLATGVVTVNGSPAGNSGIVGFTGNGVLDAPDFRGTLEHIAFTNVFGDAATLIDFGIDELQFEATVPDPTPPPAIRGPVVDTDTQVEVECIPAATIAELFINGASAGMMPPVNDVATFYGLTLEIGDVLTATQTANGDVSDLSAPVVVYSAGTALAENFDGYSTQEDLESLWTQTDPSTDRKLLLSTGSAASCDNFVVSDYASGPPVSRLYFSLGSVNGSNAEPLVVTYRYKHDVNNPNTRSRFELSSSLNRTAGALGFAFTNGIGGAWAEQYTTMIESDPDAIDGYDDDYFGYDYALTGIAREPGVWHKMQIEVLTDVVNFYIDDVLANPVDTSGTPLWPAGVPRVNSNSFEYIILGLGYSNNGAAMMYDDISVTLGGTEIPFGDPNPIESPAVVDPLFPDDLVVEVTDLDPSASDVAVYADGSLIGSATGPFGDSVLVTVSALGNAETITATQTVDGTESCFSAPVIVAVPAPTLDPILVPGQMLVDVSDIEENIASAVSVYKDLGEGNLQLIGTLGSPTADPAEVPTTPLVNDDLIYASQTIGGVEGPLSASVMVAIPAPVIVGSLDIGDTIVTVGNVHPLAEAVTVYVSDVGTTIDPAGQASVEVTVDPLQQGAIIVATQTIDSIEGPDSNVVIVANFLVVNEFSYDDSGTDNLTFIELYNSGEAAIDISGWEIQVGDYIAGQDPPGVYYQVFIPESTTIAGYGYWTVGMTDVAAIEGAVVDLIDDGLTLGDGQNYIALRNPDGILLDAVGWEMNKSNTFIPEEIYTQLGTGIWGNHVHPNDPPTAQSRFLDGLDTDNNGRDFGIQAATPGFSNNQPDQMPYLEDADDGLNVLDPIPNWVFSYKPIAAFDPAVVDAINPNAIPASPDGGLAMIAWDEAGGGNCTYMNQLAKEDFCLETYIYIMPEYTPDGGGYEETKIGIRGSADGVHNFDWYNGATGVCWLLQRGASWQTLYLLDENDGNDYEPGDAICADILGTIDIGIDTALTGWQRLLIETNGDTVTGIFGGTYGSRSDGILFTGTHAATGPGGVYISYREAVTDNSTARPPSFDALTLTEPANLIPGDIDGDGDVDLSDLAALLGSYGDCEGDPGYNPAADLNGDGCVSLSDLAELLGHYGEGT